MRCKWAIDAEVNDEKKIAFECTVCEARFIMGRESFEHRFNSDPERIFVYLADCGALPKEAFPMLQKALAESQENLIANLKKLAKDGKPFPSFVQRTGSWSKAVLRWKMAGSPVRPEKDTEAIFTNHCEPCEHYRKKRRACNICGCLVRISGKAFANKLTMATESCPDKPPRWKASVETNQDDESV